MRPLVWKVVAAGLFLAATQPAFATTYNLSSDFSSSNNPNGAWSFRYFGSPLSHQIPLNNGNSLYPAIPAAGYFSTGPDLNQNTPDVLITTLNGSAVGYTNGDFLAGNVLVHSPNSGAPVSVVWTAPSNGSISFTSSVWYAHSIVTRSNDVSANLGGDLLGSAIISNGSFGDRNNAWTLNGTNLAVTAGETLVFDFTRRTGEPFGSLNGIGIEVDFTAAVPEPSTWAMMLIGFCGLGFAGYKRAQHRAVAASSVSM